MFVESGATDPKEAGKQTIRNKTLATTLHDKYSSNTLTRNFLIHNELPDNTTQTFTTPISRRKKRKVFQQTYGTTAKEQQQANSQLKVINLSESKESKKPHQLKESNTRHRTRRRRSIFNKFQWEQKNQDHDKKSDINTEDQKQKENSKQEGQGKLENFPEVRQPSGNAQMEQQKDSNGSQKPEQFNPQNQQQDGHQIEKKHGQGQIQQGVDNNKWLAPQSQFDTRKFINLPIPEGRIMHSKIIRDTSLLNHFWPEFRLLRGDQDYRNLLFAKKISSKPTEIYVFSLDKNFQENQSSYCGKMKSTSNGSGFNIFGPGPSPSKAKELQTAPRELLATLIFKPSMLNTNNPRRFKAFVKRPECNYYKDLEGVAMSENEIELSELYQIAQNRKHIDIYKSRQARWNADIKAHIMDFKGRVSKASTKNFIMEPWDIEGQDTLLFGKVGEDKYSISMFSPLPLFLHFAISLTSFSQMVLYE